MTALFVKEADIDSIAGIGGSSLCVVVCFLLPAVFYWRAWAVPTCSLRQVRRNPRKSPLVITFTDCRGSWSKPVSGCSWS